MNPTKRSVTVCAPINIALIKYWGKRAGDMILPLNDSISVNVDALCAKSTVEACYGEGLSDSVSLNGKERPVDPQTRYYSFFARLRAILQSRDPSMDVTKWHFHVTSETNFPVSAGLASSAAGFSAMAFGIGQLFEFDNQTMSDLARVGRFILLLFHPFSFRLDYNNKDLV
ncbi:unnamed protein product [Soboliphyme baturini]|uniref:GHMP_kinases_N domain-containing protein n=1 Tax=Soboliphyme baturini TaxID=241478 RepID=A0A183I992_9BILA|nr:unnamed protein product [Soboliphyme baturini]